MSRNRKNVTITLDDETARWVRAAADRQDISVSRFVAEMLRERMREGSAYEVAKRRFAPQEPYLTRNAHRRLPARDGVHERAPA